MQLGINVSVQTLHKVLLNFSRVTNDPVLWTVTSDLIVTKESMNLLVYFDTGVWWNTRNLSLNVCTASSVVRASINQRHQCNTTWWHRVPFPVAINQKLMGRLQFCEVSSSQRLEPFKLSIISTPTAEIFENVTECATKTEKDWQLANNINPLIIYDLTI